MNDTVQGNFDIVIFANGEKPTSTIPVSIALGAKYAICCDGALTKMQSLGREPDFVVGDCDSLSQETIASLGDRLIKIAEQETNDLSKAFHFALSRFELPSPSVAIIAATGLREDHTLGNIFHLIDFTGKTPNVAMFSDYGRFEVVRTCKTFYQPIGSPVSIFAPCLGTKIKSTGLRWPLDGVELVNLWSGTLNKTDADSFSITTDKPVIVYRPY